LLIRLKRAGTGLSGISVFHRSGGGTQINILISKCVLIIILPGKFKGGKLYEDIHDYNSYWINVHSFIRTEVSIQLAIIEKG